MILLSGLFYCVNSSRFVVLAPKMEGIMIWPSMGGAHRNIFFRRVLDGWSTIFSIWKFCFVIRRLMNVEYSSAFVTLNGRVFNNSKSTCKTTVKWSSNDLISHFSCNLFSRYLKVRQTPISQISKTSAVLCNIRVCLYGGRQRVKFFKRRCPLIQD